MSSLNSNELNIVLKMIDNASADFKKVNQEAIKQIEGINKASNDNAKKTEESNKKTEKSWFKLTIKIASVIQILKLLGRGLKDVIRIGRETDTSFNKAFSNFDAAVLNVKKSIAEKLTPALTVALNYWSEFLNSKIEGSFVGRLNEDLAQANARLAQLKLDKDALLSGKVSRKQNFVTQYSGLVSVDVPIRNTTEVDALIERETALIGNIKQRIEAQRSANQQETERDSLLNEAKVNLDKFKKAQEESTILFVVGKESGEAYYRSISEGQNSVIGRNQVMAEDLRNLAVLQAQLADEELTRSRNQISEQVALLQFYQQEQRIAQQGMATLMVQVGQTMQSSLSGAITNVVTGTMKAKDAFKEFGKAMIEAVVNFVAQKIVAATIEKTLLAGTVTASKAAGAAIAAAWAPAAAMVSLATLGANAAPAAAAITSVNALSTGLAAVNSIVNTGLSAGASGVAGRAFGGDDIVTKPTMFMAGEGNRPERVTVSPVGGKDYHGSGAINIYIGSATMDSAAGISGTAEMLGRELENSLRRARSF
jgi:hypothetical protein